MMIIFMTSLSFESLGKKNIFLIYIRTNSNVYIIGKKKLDLLTKNVITIFHYILFPPI